MSKQRGFTFVEIMVVLAVIAILASIAYPSYVSSIRKSRRQDAKADVVRAQILQEKYRTNNASYAANAGAAGVSSSSPQYYQLVTAADGLTPTIKYTVTATALNDQANDSEKGVSCGSLTLTVDASGETYAPPECW